MPGALREVPCFAFSQLIAVFRPGVQAAQDFGEMNRGAEGVERVAVSVNDERVRKNGEERVQTAHVIG